MPKKNPLNEKPKSIAMIAYTRFSMDSRVQREALSAINAGYSVDFYTLEEGYQNGFENVNFIYRKVSQYNGSSKLRFIYGYMSFFLFCFFSVTVNHFKKRYRIIHVNNMPNFLVFACLVAKWTGARVVLDNHDLFPEVYAEKFKKSLDHWLIRLLYLEERLSAMFSDHIIVTNRLQQFRLLDNHVKNVEFTEVLNAADETVFNPFVNHDFDQDKLTIIYPSTIAKRLGLDLLLEAMSMVEKRNPKVSMKIYGVGEYASNVAKQIDERKLKNTHFLGRISLKKLSEEMEAAHIGVIPYPNGPSTKYQMPIKIHEYFIKGLAVISSDVEIIKTYFPDQVLLFKAGDPIDLANKILQLTNNPELMGKLSQRGHEYYKQNSWTKYQTTYVSLLDHLS